MGWYKERNEAIIEMCKNGIPKYIIANTFNLSLNYVVHIVKSCTGLLPEDLQKEKKMKGIKNNGNLSIGGLTFKQYVKRYFNTVEEARSWLLNPTCENDNFVHIDEDGKCYIFVISESQEKQSL